MSTSTMLRPMGKTAKSHEDGDDEHQRRKKMHDGVGAEWNNIFLGERFDAVSDRLKKAVGTDAIRPETILHAAEALALEYRGEREEARIDGDNGDDAEEHAGSVGWSAVGKNPTSQLAQDYENLVEISKNGAPRRGDSRTWASFSCRHR